jgi:hypothetical protein
LVNFDLHGASWVKELKEKLAKPHGIFLLQLLVFPVLFKSQAVKVVGMGDILE